MKKQKQNLIIFGFFIGMLILLSFGTYCSKFEIGDQLWNFQNVYKMYQGSLIYKEANVIITPVFYKIGYWLFCLLGANVVVFKIYNVIIYFLKFLLLYLLFRKLNFKKSLSLLYISLWFIIDISYVFCGANYNQLALVFVLARYFAVSHEI